MFHAGDPAKACRKAPDWLLDVKKKVDEKMADEMLTALTRFPNLLSDKDRDFNPVVPLCSSDDIWEHRGVAEVHVADDADASSAAQRQKAE